MDDIIGIDIGTTYCCVGLWDKVEQKVILIENEFGEKRTPCFVSFTDNSIIIGDCAKESHSYFPFNTVFNMKQLIGKTYDEIKDIQKSSFISYKINTENSICVNIKDVDYSVEELIALLIRKLKNMAETYLNHSVNKVVISVSSSFNNTQRESIKKSCEMCNLNVIRMLNDTSATAIAYKHFINVKETNTTIFVFDMGGCTTDVSILSLDRENIKVIATCGNSSLGGNHIVQLLMNYALDKIKESCHNDLSLDMNIKTKLFHECERVKCGLTFRVKEILSIKDKKHDLNYEIPISRAKFEYLIQSIIKNALLLIEEVLKMSNYTQINDIVFVGGSTHIPMLKNRILEYIQKSQSSVVNIPDSVITGTVLYGSCYRYNELLIDVTPFSLGLETMDGIMSPFINRNTPIPVHVKNTITTCENNQENILIKVYEGEHDVTKYNRLLTMFELTNIPKMNCGEPQIEVCFDIDKNGILTVSAQEMKTGIRQCVSVQKTDLSPNRLQQQINTKEEENSDRELIIAKHSYKQFIQETKQTIHEPSVKRELGTEYVKLLDVLEQGELVLEVTDVTLDEYRLAKQELENIVNAAMYKIVKKKDGEVFL